MTVSLLNGDCLAILPTITSATVHLAMLDLPYQTIGAKWDRLIDLPALWHQLRRVLNDTGTVVAFAAQPFTTDMITSARDLFRYDLVWRKNRPTGFVHAKNRVLKEHEDILVFSKGVANHVGQTKRRMTYNPQGLVPLDKPVRNHAGQSRYLTVRGKGAVQEFTNYPRSVLTFSKDESHQHETQKPLALCDYLVRTYSNPGDVVLDPTMGSGSSGVAAIAAGRGFIGIERDDHYFNVARDRMAI